MRLHDRSCPRQAVRENVTPLGTPVKRHASLKCLIPNMTGLILMHFVQLLICDSLSLAQLQGLRHLVSA